MSRKSISHLNYQELKKILKHSSREQYLKDQWPAIVLETNCLCFYLYVLFFYDDQKWYIQVVYERDS